MADDYVTGFDGKLWAKKVRIRNYEIERSLLGLKDEKNVRRIYNVPAGLRFCRTKIGDEYTEFLFFAVEPENT